MDLRDKKLTPASLAFYIGVVIRRSASFQPFSIPKSNFPKYVYGELDTEFVRLVNTELQKLGWQMIVMESYVAVIPDWNFNPIDDDKIFMDSVIFPDTRVVIHNVLRSNR